MPDDQKRLELAHRLLDICNSEMWTKTVVPYLEGERAITIELMASMTDSLQLMRYAGSIQTLHSLINLEAKAKQVIETGLGKKLEKFR